MESRALGTEISSTNSHTWKKNFIFNVIFALLITFRIWLTFGIPKCYFYAPHDDLYFAKAANDLLNGQWLGKFDDITLIKVPFYAFFLAFSSLTHLPLLFNETIFYIGACLLLDRSVQPLIKNRWWRLLLFTILLYCPASLITGWTVRVYREYVYFSLTLMVIAFAIGLLLRVNTTLKAMIGWGIGFGISLSAFLLTREEGAWIIPALFYFFICCFWIIWKKGSAQKWQQSIALFIPIFLAYLPILVVSSVNYSYYGLWGTSDQLDPDFNRVINTLGRIKTGSTWYPYVRVSHESLDKAYAASPMMAELKDKLEPLMEVWEKASEQQVDAKPLWYRQEFSNHGTEIGAGHFPWALRDAVSRAGYFSGGKYPKDYFHRLADELEAACNTGKLDCLPSQNIPFVGSIDKRHIPLILQMYIYDTRLFLKLSIIQIPSLKFSSWDQFTDYNDAFVYFDKITYNPIHHVSAQNSYSGADNFWSGSISTKSNLAHEIFILYRFFTPVISVLGLICFTLLAVRFLFHKAPNSLQQLMILVFLAGLLFSRFTTLVIVDTTTTAPGIIYGDGLYHFLYVFVAISIYLAACQVLSLKQSHIR